MINRKIYLAGPITGTAYQDTNNWRLEVTKELSSNNLIGYSPMRGKSYLSKENTILDNYQEHIMSSTVGINVRDYNDVITSGAILVNFLNSKRVSIGTVMEIAWARMKQIPIVIIMEKGNIHEHALLTYGCIVVSNIDDGVDCIIQLINE